MVTRVHGGSRAVLFGAALVAVALAVAGTAGCSSGDSSFHEATHPAAPQIISLGGPVLANPLITPVVFQGDPLASAVFSFVGTLGSSPAYSGTLAEYGVGSLTVQSSGQTAPNPGLTTLGDADLRQMLRDTFTQAKQMGTTIAWDSEVFVFFTPPGVTVTAPLGNNQETMALCMNVGGYHSFVQLDASTRAIYAVVPRCDTFGPLSGFDVVTGVASHEIAEARTDPYAADLDPSEANADPAFAAPNDLSWYVVNSGGEVGDMCADMVGAFYKDSAAGATIQHLWSNAAAAAGHDPCGIQAPYFNTAPVLGTTITLPFAGTPTTFPGLTIPVGSSQTVELDLFSDGRVKDAPWTINALDMEQLLKQTPSLTLSLDRFTGNNGDKFHLTITVTKVGQLEGVSGLAGVVLASHVDGNVSLWPILVQTQ